MANQSNNKKQSNEVKRSNSKTTHLTNPVKPQLRSKTVQKSYKKCDLNNQKHPTIAFIEKSHNEFKRLKTKTAKGLLSQISDLFESESFADISIIRGKYRKRVHSCLLYARIPSLFTQILSLNLNKNAFNPKTHEYCVRIPPEIKELELKELIHKIYSDDSANDMEKDENDLMSKIEILNKTFNEPIGDSLCDFTQSVENNSQMNLSANSVSDNRSEDERDEYDNYGNSGDNDGHNEGQESGAVRTSHMVRSGTFELLTSIHSSEDNNDLRNNGNNCKSNDEIELLDSIEQNIQNIDLNETIDHKNNRKKSNDLTPNTSTNSMFSLFIDINEPTVDIREPERPQTTKDDQKRGFDFIPLKSKPNNKLINQRSCEGSRGERRARNSADAVLMRSVDSVLPHIQTLDDIPLLPMSPIIRKAPEVQRVAVNRGSSFKRQGLGAHKIDCESSYRSSSDSFSDAYNECLNISVQSSSKNSYESDSIDVFDENQQNIDFVGNSDDESNSSDYGKEANDLDLNDSQTFRNMKSCSKLGEDLLKMFVKQVNPDIIIRVKDREIKAHKCILTSRCRYFDAMLRGNWMESETNSVDLQGFTYNSVYFALCHIYSGCLTLPAKLDLSELALLSDVLAMDSLKEIVVHELMVNRCHFFHAPCDENCTVNIIKCLKLCSRSGLNDLYHKCLNWTAKHFTKVWCNKVFASMNPQLTDACLQTKVKQLMADNVLKTTLESERMITSMPRVKWAETVFTLLAKLIEECCNTIANNYDRVITSKDFLALGRGNSWDISTLEQTLLAAMTKLCPDVSCRSLIELNKILLLQENDQMSDGFSYGPFNDQFGRLVTKMQRYCERYMIQNANHVVHCQSWSALPQETQQKIKDGAIIVFEFDKPIAPPPKLSSRLMSGSNGRKLSETSRVDHKSVEISSSKGAVPKNYSLKSRQKTNQINSNGMKQLVTKKVSNDHIYDSVPFEDIPIKVNDNKKPEFTRKVERVSNRALSLHLSQNRKSEEKIAKVSPFSVKSPELSSDDISVKDLVAEIDAETNLVTHCLQEAELLEQQLTRNLHKTQPTKPRSADKSNKSSANPTYGIVSQPQSQQQRHLKSATNGSAKRVATPKTPTTSTPILKTRPKVTKQTRK